MKKKSTKKKRDLMIEDFRENHTISFTVFVNEENMKIAEEEGLLNCFKLTFYLHFKYDTLLT